MDVRTDLPFFSFPPDCARMCLVGVSFVTISRTSTSQCRQSCARSNGTSWALPFRSTNIQFVFRCFAFLCFNYDFSWKKECNRQSVKYLLILFDVIVMISDVIHHLYEDIEGGNFYRCYRKYVASYPIKERKIQTFLSLLKEWDIPKCIVTLKCREFRLFFFIRFEFMNYTWRQDERRISWRWTCVIVKHSYKYLLCYLFDDFLTFE